MRATVTLALHRHRGRSVQFSDLPHRERAPSRRPARIAQLLALAHHIQRAIDHGTFASQSDVARRLGLTTARVTQVMNLLLLAPDIQERILELQAVDGVEHITEKQVRRPCSERDWPKQRESLARVPDPGEPFAGKPQSRDVECRSRGCGIGCSASGVDP